MRFGKRHALFWGPFFIFIVAFVLHIRQMYIMFAALGLLAPVSYLLGRKKLASIRISRENRSTMTAGEQGRVNLMVRNEGRLRQFFFQVHDDLPDGLESPEQGQILIPDLPPQTQREFSYSLIARRRGVYELGPCSLATSDHLGLYSFNRNIGDTSQVVVYPRPVPIPDLWPRSVGGRKPQKASRRLMGTGSDFYGLRDYQPGDDLKRIAWKATAKRDRMTVIETEQIEGMEAVIAFDLQSEHHTGSGDNSTIEYGVTLAASLAAQALDRGCNVGLIAKGETDYSVPISSDPQQRTKILEALARVEADGGADLGSVLASHRRYLPTGCVVAVISPAAVPEAAQAANTLRGLQHPLVWFALAPHTFGSDNGQMRRGHEALLSRLSAHRFNLVPIRGGRALEMSLSRGWYGADTARKTAR